MRTVNRCPQSLTVRKEEEEEAVVGVRELTKCSTKERETEIFPAEVPGSQDEDSTLHSRAPPQVVALESPSCPPATPALGPVDWR